VDNNIRINLCNGLINSVFVYNTKLNISVFTAVLALDIRADSLVTTLIKLIHHIMTNLTADCSSSRYDHRYYKPRQPYNCG
jgi:hypothetical protein